MKRHLVSARNTRSAICWSLIWFGSASAASAHESLPPDLGTRRGGVDWPAFLGRAGDGKSPETGLALPWPKEGPKLVWQMRVGVGYGMPAISRGRLFHFDRYGRSARVTCFNAETAAELWRFEYPTDYEDLYGYDNGPRCAPVVDGERVYVFGVEGMLHCLAALDGKVLWKVDTAKTYGVVTNFFGVGSTPVVEGELLIAQIGGSPTESAEVPPGALDQVKPNGTAVVAFDKRTGQERYRLGDDLASYAVPVLATIGDRRWCFVFARGGLLAFDPVTGKQDFHFPWRAPILESVNASNPVVVGDTVLVSETYGPGAAVLKVRSGGYDVVWSDENERRDKRLQTHWNTPIEVDGYVYGSSGRHTNNAELRCVELASGKLMWSQPGLTRSSLTLIDGHFVCLTEYGDLLLLKANPQKFDVVSHFVPLAPEGGDDPAGLGPARLLTYPAWAAPIVSHGLMYVRGQHRLACYEIIPKMPTP